MTDNELLEQLFRPAREMEMEDNGFTNRVMQQIETAEARSAIAATPQAARNTKRYVHLWTAFCIAIAALLFVMMRGWIAIGQGIYNLLTTPPTLNHLLMLFIAVSVPGVLVLTELVRRERVSVL